MISFWFYLFVFLIGSIVGSFLNVVVLRSEKNENYLRGRSHCPYCQKTLSWWQLIPVFSFFILKGKCYYCKHKISWQYPIVESLTGLVFVLIFWRFTRFPFFLPLLNNFTLESVLILLNLIFWFYWASVLIVIAVYDLRNYLILGEIIFPAIFISFIWKIIQGLYLYFFQGSFLTFVNQPLGESSFFFGYWGYFPSLFYGILVGVAPFLLLVLFSREKAMGWGDVLLALFLGIILSWPAVLVALILSFLLGGLISLILIKLKKKTFKSYLPFAPFLCFSGLVVLLFGDIILKTYFLLI